MKQIKPKSTDKKVTNNITYGLKELKVLKFALVEPLKDLTENFNIKNLKVSHNLKLGHNKEKKKIDIILSIVYHYKHKKDAFVLIDFMFLASFMISNFKSVIIFKNNNINIPNDLLSQLVSISYSSARGVVFEKTQGSFLNQYILPLIDVNELINNTIKNKPNK
ncbi:hypothetical protein ACFLSQ_06370 [Bacteroidota bacterium]